MRIFSGDGGGVFGTIPAYQLQEYDVYEEFDVLGGCSISSALVACMAMGMKGPEILGAMTEGLPKIFSKPWYRSLNPWGSKWPNTELKKWCKSKFDARLGDIHKPIFIVAMDFANRRPKVFSNTDPDDVDVPLYEAVLASVSAPTYFPPIGNYVDGGIFANNPSVVTCAGASDALGKSITDLSLYSIGTGTYHYKPIDMSGADRWSLITWGKNIIPVMLEGGNETGMAFITEQLPLKHYVRSEFVDLEADWKMDDASLIPGLIEKAKEQQCRFKAQLDKFLEDTKNG
jgi:patatin-like phospholipase/acyl hydrolase